MIVRAITLKDATTSPVTSCGAGTIFDLGALASVAGRKLYAGLHVLSSSTGGLKVRVQYSSSSGGGGMTDLFAFTCSAQRTAEWLTPLTTGTVTSTDRKFYRAIWEMTTSGESYKMLPFIGIQ